MSVFFAIACGYEDANDLDTLRYDPALKLACERRARNDEALASELTLSVLENALSQKDQLQPGNAGAQVGLFGLLRRAIALHRARFAEVKIVLGADGAFGNVGVLMQVLQEAATGTRWAQAQFSTLRLRLLKVAARVVESCRRTWVHLPTAYPDKVSWQHLHLELCADPT